MLCCKQEGLREHLNMEECMVDIKDQKAQHLKVDNCPGKKNCPNSKLLKLKTALQIWIANDDNDVEGQWTNWYTGEVGLVPPSVRSSFHDKALEYAPWGYARPYDGGFRYNCMMLQV